MTKQIKVDTNIIPIMPIVLVGTKVDGVENFMTVGWTSRVNNKPPMISIAVNNKHKTTENIHKMGEFSVVLPDTSLEEVADYCGIRSGHKVNKGQLFSTFYGELKHAPLINGSPISLACKVVQVVDLPTNQLFIGEIIEAYAQEQLTENNKVKMSSIEPIILTMPDNNYWKLGDKIGDAWHDGLKFERK